MERGRTVALVYGPALVGSVLLGLVVAAAFGSGDFAGGRASRTAPTAAVLVVASVVSVVGAVVVAVVVDARVTGLDLAFGGAAGALNVAGLGLLYRGLATGAARVIAPITAAVASLVPAAWGLATGERPGALVLVGVALEVGAVVLLAREPAAEGTGRGRVADGVAPAMAAGTLLGSSLVLFAQTDAASGQWPVLAARVAALVGAGAALVVLGRGAPIVWPSGRDRLLAAGAGLLDVTATVLLVVAVRRDLLVVVAPIAALGPGFTVLWARIVDGELIDRARRIGLAVAATGLVLVAAG